VVAAAAAAGGWLMACGQFRRLRPHGIKNPADLKKKMPALCDEALRTPESFRRLYEFTFQFGLDKDKGEKVLPLDVAMPLWELVFSQPGHTSPHLERWLAFLRKSKVRGINRDCWREFLNFTRTIKPDLSDYDPLMAWPTLLDEFVEAERAVGHS
jgi:hypothetical protein